MELDQLKSSWKELDKSPPPGVDLPTLLKQAERSAAGPLHRMKRSAVRGGIGVVVIYALAYTQFHGPMRIPVGIFYAVVALLTTVYYVGKYRLLRSMETIDSNQDMTAFFEGKLRRLRGYLRFNTQLCFPIMLGVMWFVCWLLWAYERTDFYIFLTIRFHPGQEGWIVLGWTLCALVLVVPTFYFTRWYLYRYYGRYVDMLEENLRELQNDNNA
jgi:hypothetical protein